MGRVRRYAVFLPLVVVGLAVAIAVRPGKEARRPSPSPKRERRVAPPDRSLPRASHVASRTKRESKALAGWKRDLEHTLSLRESGDVLVNNNGRRIVNLHPDRAQVGSLQPLKDGRYPYVRYAFESIHQGGRLLAKGGVTTPRRNGATAVYDRGGFEEIYKILPEGIEQFFRIPSLSGKGDLVVTGRLESNLEPHLTADGVSFRERGVESAYYKKAHVVDAAGRKAAIPIDYKDGSVRLTVSADWLARAAFPITVDPVMATADPDRRIVRSPLSYDTPGYSFSYDDGYRPHYDVVWNSKKEEFLIVWSHALGQDTSGRLTNLTIFGQRLAQDGSPRDSAFVVAPSPNSNDGNRRSPRAVYSEVHNRILVVYELARFGERYADVHGRLLNMDPASPGIGTETRISRLGGAPPRSLAPEVATGMGDFLVVYGTGVETNPHTIMGSLLRIDREGRLTFPAFRWSVGGKVTEYPNPQIISKVFSDPKDMRVFKGHPAVRFVEQVPGHRRWFVAWSEWDSNISVAHKHIVGRLVGTTYSMQDGIGGEAFLPITDLVTFTSTQAFHDWPQLAASSLNRELLMVWHTGSSLSGCKVYVPTEWGAHPQVTRSEHINFGPAVGNERGKYWQDPHPPHVLWNPKKSEYLVIWSEGPGKEAGSPSEVRAARVAGVGTGLLENHIKIAKEDAWMPRGSLATSGKSQIIFLSWQASNYPRNTYQLCGTTYPSQASNPSSPPEQPQHLMQIKVEKGKEDTDNGGASLLEEGERVSNAYWIGFVAAIGGEEVRLTAKLEVQVQVTGKTFEETGVKTYRSDPSMNEIDANKTWALLILTEDLGEGAYHWRARTVPMTGSPSDWTYFGTNDKNHADFAIIGSGAEPQPQPLTPPALVSPDHNASIQASSTTLQWTQSSESADVTYTIELTRTDGQPTPPIPQTKETELTIANLPAAEYSWRVQAALGTATAWSGSRKFVLVETAAPPGPQHRPSIKWGPVQWRYKKGQGGTQIAPGGAARQDSQWEIVLAAIVEDADASHKVTLQVEVKPVGTHFTSNENPNNGLDFRIGPFVQNGGEATVRISDLAQGGYHWRARAVDTTGAVSSWSYFGTNDKTKTDFVVDNTAPGAPALVSPAQNAQLQPGLVTLKWNAVSDPSGVSFHLMVIRSDGWLYEEKGIKGDTLSTSTTLSAGQYQWTVRAIDGAGNESPWTQPRSFTVVVPNRKPKLDAITDKSVNENSPLSFTVSATDPDGDTVTLSASGLPLGAAFANGAFSWTPSYTQAGAYQVTFKATDSGNLSDQKTITIIVSNVNRKPKLDTITDQSVNENSLLSFTVSATDPDDDTVTLSASGLLLGASFANGAFSWTPSYSQSGAYQVTFKATDSGNLSDEKTITIIVSNVNQVAVANSQSVTTPEDTPKQITLTGNDADGDNLTYTVVDQPQHGTLSGTGANRTYTPSANYHGPDSFTFKANDGSLDSSIATVSITVTAVNDAPTANNLSVTTQEDTPVNVAVSGTDPDGDTLSFIIVSQPAHGTLSGNDPLVYAPNAGYTGADSFSFKVYDGVAYSNVAGVSITVIAADDDPPTAPALLSPTNDAKLYESTVLLDWSDVEDPSGVTYTVEILGQNAFTGLAESKATTAPLAAGTYSWRVRAVDGKGNKGPWSEVRIFKIEMAIMTIALPDGSAGIAYQAAIQVSGGQAPHIFEIASGELPPGLSLSPLTGKVSGAPTAPGEYFFTLRVADASEPALSASRDYTVRVDGVIVPMAIDSNSILPTAYKGLTYAHLFVAAGGYRPYTWLVSAGELPAGLSLDPTLGLLVGKAAAPGTYEFELTAQDSATEPFKKSMTFTLKVLETDSELSVRSSYGSVLMITLLPRIVVGSGFAAQFFVAGEATWAISSGLLPAGLALHPTSGALEGAPLAAGRYHFVLKAASGEAAAYVAVRLDVDENGGPAPVILTKKAPIGDVKLPYSFTLAAAGGALPYSWSVVSGTLPPGLSLDAATGEIGGTFSEAGSWTIEVQASDANGQTAVRKLVLATATPPAPSTPVTNNSGNSSSGGGGGGSCGMVGLDALALLGLFLLLAQARGRRKTRSAR